MYWRLWRTGWFAAAFLFLTCSFALADAANHIVRDDFDWQVAETAHFEVYYDTQAAPIVSTVAYYLEKAYDRTTRDLDIVPKKKSRFFLFISQEGFEQNNIAFVGEATGGVTEAFKNRFVLPHLGSHFWLDRVITHEFTHVLEFEYLFGGFYKSVHLLKFPFYPDWLMEGLAEYETGESDAITREMVIREAFLTGQLPKLSLLYHFGHLKPHFVVPAYKTGQKVLQFIAQKYGRDKVPAILKQFDERFDTERVIRDVLGVNFRTFESGFRKSLADQYEPWRHHRKMAKAYGEMLTSVEKLPTFNTQPIFSPDGQTLAYFSDRKGYEDIYFLDLSTQKHRALGLRRFSHLIDRFGGRGFADSFTLDWSPNGRMLTFVGVKALKQYLFLYDIDRDRLERVSMDFQLMSNPVFMPDSQHVVLIGMRQTQTDLYRCDTKSDLIQRLTFGLADVSDPAISPDGSRIAYSAETLKPDDPDLVQQRKLFLLDLAHGTTHQIMHLPRNQTDPAFSPDAQRILFVSDHEGTFDLYEVALDSGTPRRLTQARGGFSDPTYTPEGTSVVWSAYEGVDRHLYRAPLENFEKVTDSSTVVAVPLTTVILSTETVPHVSTGTLVGKGISVSSPTVMASSGTAVKVSTAPLATHSELQQAATLTNLHRFGWRDMYPSFLETTDFFLPLLVYSSDGGLFVTGAWQASSMLNNHLLQAAGTYGSKNSLYGYSVTYAYQRFRPQLFLGAFGENSFLDFRETLRERDTGGFAGISYPLDRFDSLLFAVEARDRLRIDEPANAEFKQRRYRGTTGFFRDTVSGRYLTATRGHRLLAAFDSAQPVVGGDIHFNSQRYEWHQFFPGPWPFQSALAWRIKSRLSDGRDPEGFFVSGLNGVRGASGSRDNLASNILVANAEYRFPLFRDLNWQLLGPSWLFKELHSFVFSDAGYLWSSRAEFEAFRFRDLRNSVGAGIRFYTFVFQSFPLILEVQGAQRLDAQDHEIYFTIGPEF